MDETALRKIGGRYNFSLASLEKDYMLTRVLYEISRHDLEGRLAFKGGTALNKVYLGYYRLSEDLDFTAINAGTGYIKKLIREIAKELKIGLKEEHITQYSYIAVFRFTGPLNHPNSINIDINTNEKLIMPALKRMIKHFYEFPSFEIHTMELKELMAEKIRSLIQRKKPRDYFDVWYALKRDKGLLKGMKSLLIKKCENAKIGMDLSKIFSNLEDVEALWNHHLVELIERLPNFNKVIEELRESMGRI